MIAQKRNLLRQTSCIHWVKYLLLPGCTRKKLRRIFTISRLAYWLSQWPAENALAPDPNEEHSLRTWMSNLTAFLTAKRGYFGTGPWSVGPGDEVWVILGSNMPFILRPKRATEAAGLEEGEDRSGAGRDEYRLVGDCYVHGIMHGEVFRGEEGWENEHVEVRTIRLF